MLTLQSPIDQVRDACISNNLRWLTAFGCVIDQNRGWVKVWHDELPEYRALIVLGNDYEFDLSSVRSAVRRAAADSLAVYVEDVAKCAGWSRLLKQRGFQVTAYSLVRTIRARRISRQQYPLQMLFTEGSGHSEWAELYSRAFERLGPQSAIDARRWLKAFAVQPVQHYLYRYAGEAVGVCQLCLNEGVAGLYSFGFLPSARNPRNLRVGAVLALEEVFRQGFRLAYFERSRKYKLLPNSGSNFHDSVRVFQIWSLA